MQDPSGWVGAGQCPDQMRKGKPQGRAGSQYSPGFHRKCTGCSGRNKKTVVKTKMCKLQERTKLNRLDEWDDGEQAWKRKGKRLYADAWLDAENAPKASRVARLFKSVL
jgi:hypothetical protein